MTASTSQERRSGWRIVSTPKSGPIAIVQTTNRVSMPPASAAGESPARVTRYGTPQSSVNTIIENWVPMWPKKPSRVPGPPPHLPQRRGRSPAPTCRRRGRPGAGRARCAPRRARARRRRALAAAAAPNAVRPARAVQQRARTARAERTWPSWQRIVVTCVISGTRRAGNQRGTSASTASNTTASPAPTSTRRARPAAAPCAKASRSWPAASSTPLTTSIAREPNRSTSSPAGIWAAMYTATCTKTNADSVPGLIANRSAASRPATPSVVRCMTART